MSEIKLYWKDDALFHSKSLFTRAVNVLEEKSKILNDLKDKLNQILNINDLPSYTGNILLFESKNKESSRFATPFLNLININRRIVEEKEMEDLLWLILHENLHIMKADIIQFYIFIYDEEKKGSYIPFLF